MDLGQLVKDGIKKMSEAAMDAVVTSIVANQEHHLGHLQDMQKWGIVKVLQRLTSYKYLHQQPCVVPVSDISLIDPLASSSTHPQRVAAPSVGSLSVDVGRAKLLLLGHSLTSKDSAMKNFEWKVVVNCGPSSTETTAAVMSRENQTNSYGWLPEASKAAECYTPLHEVSWEEQLFISDVRDIWGDVCVDVYWKKLESETSTKKEKEKGKSPVAGAIVKEFPVDDCSETNIELDPPTGSTDQTEQTKLNLKNDTNPARRKAPVVGVWRLYGRAIIPLSSFLSSYGASGLNENRTQEGWMESLYWMPCNVNGGDFWVHLFPHDSIEKKYYRPVAGYPGFGMLNPGTTLGFIHLKMNFSFSCLPVLAPIYSTLNAPSTRWTTSFTFEPQYLETYGLRCIHIFTNFPRWVPKFFHLLSHRNSATRNSGDFVCVFLFWCLLIYGCLVAPIARLPFCVAFCIILISASYRVGHHEFQPARNAMLFRRRQNALDVVETTPAASPPSDPVPFVETNFQQPTRMSLGQIDTPRDSFRRKSLGAEPGLPHSHTDELLFEDLLLSRDSKFLQSSQADTDPDLTLYESKTPKSSAGRESAVTNRNSFGSTCGFGGTRRLDEVQPPSTPTNAEGDKTETRNESSFISRLSRGTGASSKGKEHAAKTKDHETTSAASIHSTPPDPLKDHSKDQPKEQPKENPKSTKKEKLPISIIESPFGALALTVNDPSSYCPAFPVFADDAGEQDLQLMLEHGLEMLDGVQRMAGVFSHVVEKLKFAFNWEDPFLTVTSCFLLLLLCFSATFILFICSILPPWIARLPFVFPFLSLIFFTDPWILDNLWVPLTGLHLPLLWYSCFTRGPSARLNQPRQKQGSSVGQSGQGSAFGHGSLFGPTSEGTGSGTGSGEGKFLLHLPEHSVADTPHSANPSFPVSFAGTEGGLKKPAGKETSSQSTPAWPTFKNTITKMFKGKEDTEVAKDDNTIPDLPRPDLSRPDTSKIRRRRSDNSTQKKTTTTSLTVVGVSAKAQAMPFHATLIKIAEISWFRRCCRCVRRPFGADSLPGRLAGVMWRCVGSCGCTVLNRLVVVPLTALLVRVCLYTLRLVDVVGRLLLYWWMRLPDRREIEHRQIAASQFVDSLNDLLPASFDDGDLGFPQYPGGGDPTGGRELSPSDPGSKKGNVERYLDDQFKRSYISRNPISGLMNIRLMSGVPDLPGFSEISELAVRVAKPLSGHSNPLSVRAMMEVDSQRSDPAASTRIPVFSALYPSTLGQYQMVDNPAPGRKSSSSSPARKRHGRKSEAVTEGLLDEGALRNPPEILPDCTHQSRRIALQPQQLPPKAQNPEHALQLAHLEAPASTSASSQDVSAAATPTALQERKLSLSSCRSENRRNSASAEDILLALRNEDPDTRTMSPPPLSNCDLSERDTWQEWRSKLARNPNKGISQLFKQLGKKFEVSTLQSKGSSDCSPVGSQQMDDN